MPKWHRFGNPQADISWLWRIVFVIIGPFLSEIPDACTTAAILMVYGFLAAFIWINIIAVDILLGFRPSAAFSHSDEEQWSLTVYYVVGWGIPLLLVGLSLGMNYSDIGERFRPEFGGSRCWYMQRYAMLVYFGVPIALSIILNIILFIYTSINLNKALNTSATSQTFYHLRQAVHHHGNHLDFWIYLSIHRWTCYSDHLCHPELSAGTFPVNFLCLQQGCPVWDQEEEKRTFHHSGWH